MIELNSKQRGYLTKRAHNLDPVVFIGKAGIGPNLVKAVNDALEHHELIKIKFVDMKEFKEGIMSEIVPETDSVLVRIIGNIAILYRENPDIRNYHLPRA